MAVLESRVQRDIPAVELWQADGTSTNHRVM